MSWLDLAPWGWVHRGLSYSERRRLTCQVCGKLFKDEEQKHRHAKNVHGYFTHGNGEKREDLLCPHCEIYVPGKYVLNPKGCLRNHMRRVHGDYAKPFIIEEQPF